MRRISFTKSQSPISVELPGSKSITNRALIIHSLTPNCPLPQDLSEANDCKVMQEALHAMMLGSPVFVEDAGTVARFILGRTLTHLEPLEIMGSKRMHKRPMKDLLDPLKMMGKRIQYLNEEGFLPIRISGGFNGVNEITVKSNLSSQFVSALMLIAPTLQNGLLIRLEDQVVSASYLQMTAEVMRQYGAEIDFDENFIKIHPTPYKSADYKVEIDWSSAAFPAVYSCVAEQEIRLPGLSRSSIHGDAKLIEFLQELGCEIGEENGIIIQPGNEVSKELHFDFTTCPDLAIPIAIICAIKQYRAIFSGVDHLRFKESDRLAGLANELPKLGARFSEGENGWETLPISDFEYDESNVFECYDDHRFAMGFAMATAAFPSLTINNPECVVKSFPNFWEEARKMGYCWEQ